MYSKTCVKRPLSKDPKLVYKTNYRVMQVIRITECSKGSMLQYFRSSLSNHLSLRSLFCLFLSCRLHGFDCISIVFRVFRESKPIRFMQFKFPLVGSNCFPCKRFLLSCLKGIPDTVLLDTCSKRTAAGYFPYHFRFGSFSF